MNSLNLISTSSSLRLIVGLGNVGDRYSSSRHNVGFYFLDALKITLEEHLKDTPEVSVEKEYTSYHFRELGLTLLKPNLYMNRSGDSLFAYLKYNQLNDLKEMLVVHDDLDISFGKYKLQLSKSPKAHNGILSIETILKTKEFYRLRLGIDNREDRTIPPSNFVLMNMNNDEKKVLDELIKQIIENEFKY